MDLPLTEVQKFIKETQRQIDEEGLLGMSGTHFDRGDKPIRVLKAKQFEHRVYNGGMVGLMNPKNRKGKFASIARIAQSLNAMYESIKNDKLEPFTFDDSHPLETDNRVLIDDVLTKDK